MQAPVTCFSAASPGRDVVPSNAPFPVDEAYSRWRLVLDNLNTHTASLYETFPPAEARRIAKRLEFHHTPA